MALKSSFNNVEATSFYYDPEDRIGMRGIPLTFNYALDRKLHYSLCKIGKIPLISNIYQE